MFPFFFLGFPGLSQYSYQGAAESDADEQQPGEESLEAEES